MRGRSIRYAVAALLSGAVALAVAAVCLAGSVLFGRALRCEHTLYIYPDTPYEQVRYQVEGMLPDGLHRAAFTIYASHLGLPRRCRDGHYVLPEGMSVVQIARTLALGLQTPVRLVVGNARTLPQLAGRVARQIAADSTAVAAVLRDSVLRRELGYERDSLIAAFVPDTYEIYWNVQPGQLVRRLVREGNAFWAGAREAKLGRLGLTRYEAMTLASMVYEETKVVEDMPRIAGVFVNRLRRGIPLQACPTVKFAMQQFELRRVLYEHLRYKSPYNTYVNKGLPPGPICIPSVAAIDAVLDFEQSDYLFFCADPAFNGGHVFARTLKEHNANARRYSDELNRRNIK